MKPSFARDIEERFLRYVRIDTTSDEESSEVPSTARQLDLQRLLVSELREMGASDVTLTPAGYVLATIPATMADHKIPVVALLAHVDTVQAYSGKDVRPVVHRNYDGAPIPLPDDPTKVLDPETIPLLKEKIGHTLITASGTTLLGGDDKSGVAVLMSLASHLLNHPELPHGAVRLCFTPDEEIGRGVEHIERSEIAADVAYTLDGGSLGEVTFETFSADKAVVTIEGISIHPGTAKGVMVNAVGLAARLLGFLPAYARTPETTDGREGFIHAVRIDGNAARTRIHFILRDFERDGLAAHGRALAAACDALQALDPRAKVSCEITPQYRNMRYWLEKDLRPVEKANEAIRRAGLTPASRPARGGTDGSRLTERGLPTPNLFAGMYNVHGPLEWASVEDMEAAAQVALHLVELWAEP